MTRLSFALLFAAWGAACGNSEEPGTAPDAPPTPDDPPIVGEAGFAERITLAGDCIVITRGGMVVCVPKTGGAPREIIHLRGRQIVEPLGDGDAILLTHHGLADAPDERDLRIDRLSLTGTVTAVGAVDAAPDAGEGLALAGDRIVFSHGGSAAVSTVPASGGTPTRIVADGGNIADLAVLGSTVYFVNWPFVRTQGMTDPVGRGTMVATVAWDTHLASDGTYVVAATHLPDAATSTLHILPGTRTVELAGLTGRVVAVDGTAYVITGDDIVAVELATGTLATFAAGTRARDLVVDATHVYWTDSAGTVRALPR